MRHEDRYLPLRSKRVYVAGPAAAGLTAALQPELAATGGRIVASPAQADVIVAATRDAVSDAAQQRLVRGLVGSGPRGPPAGGHPGRGRGSGVRLRHGSVVLRFAVPLLSFWARVCVDQPAGWRSPGPLTIGRVFDPQLTSRPAQPHEETTPATGAAPAPGRPPLRGVVADWGGVMTNPIAETVRAWIAADEIEYSSYHAVMKAWVTGAYDGAGEDNPIHVLERGECSDEEFERMLAAQIVRRDGNPVTAAGLLDRMFAATVLSEPMQDLLRRVRAAGLKTAMLSNSWGVGIYPADVLAELFDAVVISAEVGMRKPEERIFRHAVGLLGLDPAECVFIDDIEANVQAAEALGMTGVLHTDAAATAGRLAELLGLS
jgi:putative hydrolase of the HAD superfamily